MEAEKLKSIIDEFGSQPLKFRTDGSRTRYELLKMVANTNQKPSSVYQLISDANKLLDWINDEQKSPLI